MKEASPFDQGPEPVLGEALRRALDPGDPAAFVARVLARASEVRAGSWDAVLARWSRVGVAAAMVIAAGAGYLLSRSGGTAPSGRPSVADALLVPQAQAPEVEVVLASFLGN